MPDCSKHPDWMPTGLEWRCPYCAVTNDTGRAKPLTAKQWKRVADAGKAVRIDDLSGGAWDTIRKRIRLRDNYTCQSCKIAVRAGIVDHIKPLKDGGSNADDNLQLLCHDCHTDKTNKDQGYKVRTKFDEYGFPLDPDHHWNK